MKLTTLVDVPPGVVTVTVAAPAVPAGAVAVTEVAELTTTLVAAFAPNLTPVAPVRLVPVMVTTVPPPAGLLVDEVLGFRRFAESEFSGDAPPTVVRCGRFLAGAFRRGAENWPVLSLRTLVESPSFQDAAV